MGKTCQAAQLTHERFFDHRSLLQNILLISAKLNFHEPLVCSTICYIEVVVSGISVWQISKKHFAGVVKNVVKSLSCVSCAA